MKSTKIVKRIDDFGCVVIPKEVCEAMHIYAGDPLEIFTTNDGCICLKRQNQLKTKDEQIEALLKATGERCVVFDRDDFLVASNRVVLPIKDELIALDFKSHTICGKGEELGTLFCDDEFDADIEEVKFLCKMIANIACENR